MHQCSPWQHPLLAATTFSVVTPSNSTPRRRPHTPIMLQYDSVGTSYPSLARGRRCGNGGYVFVLGFREWQDSGQNERSRGESGCDKGGEERRMVCTVLMVVLEIYVLYTSWVCAQTHSKIRYRPHRLAGVITSSVKRSATARAGVGVCDAPRMRMPGRKKGI